MLVDLRGVVREFISQNIHQALHKITLSHQQILPYTAAVTLELVLLNKYLQQLLVRNYIGMIDPLP